MKAAWWFSAGLKCMPTTGETPWFILLRLLHHAFYLCRLRFILWFFCLESRWLRLARAASLQLPWTDHPAIALSALFLRKRRACQLHNAPLTQLHPLKGRVLKAHLLVRSAHFGLTTTNHCYATIEVQHISRELACRLIPASPVNTAPRRIFRTTTLLNAISMNNIEGRNVLRHDALVVFSKMNLAVIHLVSLLGSHNAPAQSYLPTT